MTIVPESCTPPVGAINPSLKYSKVLSLVVRDLVGLIHVSVLLGSMSGDFHTLSPVPVCLEPG